MKLIYIDVETTGIPYPQSGIIQLAGAIEIEGQKLGTAHGDDVLGRGTYSSSSLLQHRIDRPFMP